MSLHGPPTHHNPLSAATRETLHVAREAKSPLLEKAAIWAMIGSAVTTAATAVLHSLHMIRRDWKEDRREREKERRAEATPLPSERPGHDAAPADLPPQGDGGRWTRREERAQAAGQARAR